MAATGCLNDEPAETDEEDTDDEEHPGDEETEDVDEIEGELGVEPTGSWRSFHENPANTGYTDADGVTNEPEHYAVYSGGPVNGAPAVAEGITYFSSTDGYLYAVDEGGQRWRYDTGARSTSSPAVEDGTVYVGNDAGELHAVDVSSGEREWRYRGEGAVRAGVTVDVDENQAYYCTTANRIYAVELEGGQEIWTFSTNEQAETTPAKEGGYVHVTTRGAVLYRIDPENGEQVNSHSADDGVRSSPAAIQQDGRTVVCYGSEDRRVYCVEFWSTGGVRQRERRWRYRTDGNVRSSPAITEDRVYVGSDDGNLYSIDLETGDEEWRLETDGQIRSSPVATDDAVYFGNDDQYVYAVDRETGEELWSHRTGDIVRSSPAVTDEVYIGSTDDALHSYR